MQAGGQGEVDVLVDLEAQTGEHIGGEGGLVDGVLHPAVADAGADEGLDATGGVELVGILDDGGAGGGVDGIRGDDVAGADIEAEVGVLGEVGADADTDDRSVVGVRAAREGGVRLTVAELEVEGEGLGGGGHQGQDREVT